MPKCELRVGRHEAKLLRTPDGNDNLGEKSEPNSFESQRIERLEIRIEHIFPTPIYA